MFGFFFVVFLYLQETSGFPATACLRETERVHFNVTHRALTPAPPSDEPRSTSEERGWVERLVQGVLTPRERASLPRDTRTHTHTHTHTHPHHLHRSRSRLDPADPEEPHPPPGRGGRHVWAHPNCSVRSGAHRLRSANVIRPPPKLTDTEAGPQPCQGNAKQHSLKRFPQPPSPANTSSGLQPLFKSETRKHGAVKGPREDRLRGKSGKEFAPEQSYCSRRDLTSAVE